MKTVLSGVMIVLACLAFSGRAHAAKTPSPTPAPTQIAPPIPGPQRALHDQLALTLSQVARGWTADEAAKAAKNPRTAEGNIRADIQTRFTGQSLTDADKNILLFVVLTEVVDHMGNDLSDLVNDLKTKHTQGQASNSNPGGNTTISLTPEETTQLQTAIQRRNDFMNIMTTLMKKLAGVQGGVVGNLQ